MKRLILTVALMLVLCGAARAEDPNQAITLWVSGSDFSYQNSDVSVWLGFRQDNVEAGVATNWRMFSEGDIEGDIQSNLAVGPYGAYHFPGLVDVNNPIDVDWLPDKLLGEPFVSLSYLFDVQGRGTAISPGVGVRLLDIFALTYEYSMYQGIPASDQGRIGLSFKWEF